MQLAAALQPSLYQAHTSDVVLSHTFLKSPALLFFPSAHKRGRLLGAAAGLWPPPAPGGSSFRAPVQVLRKSRASLFAWTPVSFASRHKPHRAAQPNLEVDGVDTVTAQMPVQSRTVEPCVTIFKHSWTGEAPVPVFGAFFCSDSTRCSPKRPRSCRLRLRRAFVGPHETCHRQERRALTRQSAA